MSILILPLFKITKNPFFMVLFFLIQVLQATEMSVEQSSNKFWTINHKKSKHIKQDLLVTFSQVKSIQLTSGKKETPLYLKLLLHKEIQNALLDRLSLMNKQNFDFDLSDKKLKIWMNLKYKLKRESNQNKFVKK